MEQEQRETLAAFQQWYAQSGHIQFQQTLRAIFPELTCRFCLGDKVRREHEVYCPTCDRA